MKVEYSDKELKLIHAYLCVGLIPHVSPEQLYRRMMEKAFLSNDQSDYAKSLRRCIEAFRKCKPYRLTKEWDEMIDIPYESGDEDV